MRDTLLNVRRLVCVRICEQLCQISIMPYSMPDLMQLIVTERAEALHVYPSAAPVLEVKRTLYRLKGAKLTSAGVEELLHTVADADDFLEFEHEDMVSFDYHFGDAAAFQVIAFREDGHAWLEIRRLDDKIQDAA
jgi:Tfp pilus assembly ATPase PilU